MANEEILGGLKSAIDRGESLQKAMMTFYNAGYKKEEIEEAARFLNEHPIEQPPVSVATPSAKPKLGLFSKKQESTPSVPISVPQAPVEPAHPVQQIVSDYGASQQPQQIQSVSGYEKKEPKDRVMVVILITILVLLLGLLASIFIFKQEIVNFFANALG